MHAITWEPKLVKVADLIENPQNPKILNETGKERLQYSLGRFGLAGTIICNLNMHIIDGHSRKKELLEQGVDEVYASMPSRLLTDQEYKELNAFYDAAKAGDVDNFMIENMFSDEVLTEWGMKNEKVRNSEKELYPIVPKYDEKHQAFIILCETDSEASFIRNALLLDTNSSYKNKSVGETHVTTAQQFIKTWNAK